MDKKFEPRGCKGVNTMCWIAAGEMLAGAAVIAAAWIIFTSWRT